MFDTLACFVIVYVVQKAGCDVGVSCFQSEDGLAVMDQVAFACMYLTDVRVRLLLVGLTN